MTRACLEQAVDVQEASVGGSNVLGENGRGR